MKEIMKSDPDIDISLNRELIRSWGDNGVFIYKCERGGWLVKKEFGNGTKFYYTDKKTKLDNFLIKILPL